jgi:hypothetical protein
MLGLVSEQFPRGGAMTLNTVSAMGLLTVGIFGFPFLGAVQDHYNTQTIERVEPQLYAEAVAGRTYVDRTDPEEPVEKPLYESKNFFGFRYDSVNKDEFLKAVPGEERTAKLNQQLLSTSRSSLKVASVLPLVMAIAFLLIIIWFAVRGGYRAVSLDRKTPPPDAAKEQPATTL